MRCTVAKTSMYTNPENLFSVEMNFDEDLIGAKRTEEKRIENKVRRSKERKTTRQPPPKSN